VRSARMEQARLQTELESLGREVDPHFLFNNLNALVHLIEQRSEAAPGFIPTLSATYRYVLDCRGRTLVPLAEELAALKRHRALAEIRYGADVRLDVQCRGPTPIACCSRRSRWRTVSECAEAQHRRQ
jgi:LytS/YehU family sensor histidine kinase